MTASRGATSIRRLFLPGSGLEQATLVVPIFDAPVAGLGPFEAIQGARDGFRVVLEVEHSWDGVHWFPWGPETMEPVPFGIRGDSPAEDTPGVAPCEEARRAGVKEVLRL